jgi:predicted nucleic acid-binding protein
VQPKLFVIHHLLLVGVLMIVGLTIFSQVFTSIAAATATSEMKDMELEDKAIKEELESSETEEIDEEDDNTAKQEEEGKEEEEQESNDDTAGTGLAEDNIIIENNYTSNGDDVPLELPFDNPMPFP